ncbi:MAG: hypothetical protein KGL39_60700 [Patescibacteria group bacterium]|nr:hypothetical protein [Patescibacteria group bacterium]
MKFKSLFVLLAWFYVVTIALIMVFMGGSSGSLLRLVQHFHALAKKSCHRDVLK